MDYTLSGLTAALTNRMPIIALLSISKSSKIYWAKALRLKVDNGLYRVQFSSDGVLMIAHSGHTTNGNFIVVIGAATGNIVSSRIY
jgi:hypothetical protein